jgi:hypothetical protein
LFLLFYGGAVGAADEFAVYHGAAWVWTTGRRQGAAGLWVAEEGGGRFLHGGAPAVMKSLLGCSRSMDGNFLDTKSHLKNSIERNEGGC